MELSQEEWGQRLKDIPPRKPDPRSWGTRIRQLSIDEMDGLGVDRDAGIYWHGKPIQIRQWHPP